MGPMRLSRRKGLSAGRGEASVATSGSRRWRAGVVAVATMLMLGGTAGLSPAQVVGTPDVIGQWTAPFEEGGADTPRCVPDDTSPEPYLVCKPVAQGTAVLPDGRVFYLNGVDGNENGRYPWMATAPSAMRDSRARVLDLRSGTPEFVAPDPYSNPNPNIRPGHRGPEDPLGVAGVPGRPGDGFVGSAWGAVGGPPHNPTSPPDDPQQNDGDLFCGDFTLLPDGRILTVGGSDWYAEPDVMARHRGDPADVGVLEIEGLRTASLFDWRTDSFAPAGSMKYGRWYPAVAIGPDGRPTVFSGVTKIVKGGFTQLGNVRRTETYDPDTNRWEENYTGPASETSLNIQPRIVLTPDGKFFYAAVGEWGAFGQAIDEALFAFNQSFDPATKQWSVLGPAPLGAVDSAFVVPLTMTPPYERMDILTFGGALGLPPPTLPATPLSTITAVGDDGRVSHRMTGSLHHARWFPSGILLPDGKVLAVGGMDKVATSTPGLEIPVKTAELYDPATGEWSEVAAHSRDRAYHHSAVLLPDMRVLVGGQTPLPAHLAGTNQDQGGPFASNDRDPSFEIWSPPYLFRGSRPSITRAPAGIAYGQRFEIGTSVDEIDSVVLLRLSSVQHANDADERGLTLEFTPTGQNMLEAIAPPGGNVAPPGHYYLVVNKKSPKGPIPSVARIVRIGLGSDTTEAIQPYPDQPPAPANGSATPDPDSRFMAEIRQARAAGL